MKEIRVFPRLRASTRAVALTTLALVACDGRAPVGGSAAAASAQPAAQAAQAVQPARPTPVAEVDILILPNNMVIHCGPRKLTALAGDGAVAWELPVPEGETVIAPAAAAANSEVYVRTSHGLRAASPEGKWLWSKPVTTPSTSMPADASAPVAMSDSTAVVIDGQAVVRIDSAGAERWRLNLPEGVPMSRLKASMDGGVLVPTTAGLYSVSGDGQIAWHRKLGG